MASHEVCLLILISVCISNFCVTGYAVPEIRFEAFEPRGFRVSIPAEEGVELFAFHGNLNKDILQIEPGDFSEDVTKPKNGRFSYINPEVKLKKGDVIHYWVFVQHELLGYRKDDQSWTVEKLKPLPDLNKVSEDNCKPTISKARGKDDLCSGDDIINYKFTEASIDPNFWIIEQYIPNGPDYEYVIYKNMSGVIGVYDNALRIWPKIVPEIANSSITIEGCTHPNIRRDCEHQFEGNIYNPPIYSGKIISKEAFCFGEISVKAKIPQGDWIFPQIYLEDVKEPKRRIVLAYARGNRELTTMDGTEIGGKLLYGGPYNSDKLSVRENQLAQKRFDKHIGDDWHVFTVRWAKDKMDLLIDGEMYGTIDEYALQSTGFDKETMVRVVLGLGVGGENHFPDRSVSGSYLKPWKSRSSYAIKNFLTHRDDWERTWKTDNKLLVEYVTVKAL